MKKKFYFILFFLFNIFVGIDLVVADTTCTYSTDSVNYFHITYNETSFSATITDRDGNNLEKSYIPDPINPTPGIELEFDSGFTFDKWMDAVNSSNSDNSCPYSIVIGYYRADMGTGYNNLYFIQDSKGKWPRTSEKVAMCTNCNLNGNIEDIFGDDFDNCGDLIGTDVINIINEVLDYIKILVPITLIALGIFDFLRAIVSSTEEDMKKTQKTFIRRLLVAILIFLAPYLINAFISIINDVAGFTNGGTCGIF